MKRLLVIIILISIFTACNKGEKQPINDVYFNAGIKSISPPILAPNFDLKNLEGKNINLSDYQGKVVVMNFWAHWCGPCIEEMPSINNLYNKTKDLDVEIITINLGEGPDIVEPYILENNFNFTVLLDQKKSVADLYGIRSIPSTFIIDKKGNLVAQKLGAYQWDNPQLLEIIRGLAE